MLDAKALNYIPANLVDAHGVNDYEILKCIDLERLNWGHRQVPYASQPSEREIVMIIFSDNKCKAKNLSKLAYTLELGFEASIDLSTRIEK